MEVRVRYEVVSRATISCISYNHQYDLLGLVADGNDTASFFSPQPDLSLIPRFTGQSKPPSSGHISLSPNGMFIAVANIKVELWKFDGTRMAPFRVVNQGYIQIKGIAWSEDSKHYVCYGITPKDVPLSINIRNIQTNQLKQIITQDTPILVNFDPFGKYIAVLMLKNNIDLYDASTLDKIRSISLAQNKNDVPTLRDKRLADWSPEFSYLFCPNLHDSKIPTAVIFDRNKNFAIKDILVGHQSPISCAKFNPQVFEYQHDTVFILAVGDSSGCLSLWRIGKLNSYKQPLFIASSPDKAQQSIEGIQWNSQGNILFINVLKKYVIMMGFRHEDFGRKFSEQQKSNLIISTYGASGVNQITSTRLQVFGQSDFTMKNQVQHIQQPKVIKQNSFHAQPQNRPKQPLIKTKQQTFYVKDANNKQKKRINPSKLIPQSSIIQKQQQQISQKPDVIINGHNNNVSQIGEKLQLPIIKLPSIKQDIKKQYTLPNNQILVIQNSKNVYILSVKSRNSLITQGGFKRFFSGQIKFIATTRSNIFVLSSQKIFIFDFKLKLTQIPCFVGDISNIAVNNQGTLYFLATNGLIRGFNYLKHQFLLETSIGYLLLGNEAAQITSNPLLMFSVFDKDNERIHIQLKSTLSRFFFCKQTNSWVQFDFQQGFYVPGHSLRIKKIQKVAAQHFYRNLIAPSLIINTQDKNEPAVSTFELQLIYYRLYAKDVKKYKDSLVKMLADLKTKGNNQTLRSQIINYFIDKNSPNYTGDKELWEKVKRIGGKVIQQFMILQEN